MAIKNIIAKGIGFAPATVKWIVTHGFGIGEAAALPVVDMDSEIGPATLDLDSELGLATLDLSSTLGPATIDFDSEGVFA